MAWPSGTIGTTNLDASTDSPSLARSQLLTAVQSINTIVAARGQATGVCETDAASKVPVSRIPTVPISQGGTGATNVTDARTNLGLGTAAIRNVAVAGGVASLSSNIELNQKLAGFAAAADGTVPVKSGSSYVHQVLNTVPPAASVGQSQLKVAVFEASFGPAAAPDGEVFFSPAGRYGFWIRGRQSGTNSSTASGFGVGSYFGGTAASAYRTHFLISISQGFGTALAEQQYITASPPYDMGDGQVAAFYFADVRPDGSIVATYAAPDPPWVHSGPTRCEPDWIDPETGKTYIDEIVDNDSMKKLRKRLNDPIARAEFLAARRTCKKTRIEITEDRKHKDMDIIPHPFITPMGTPVLLDPVGDAISDLEVLRDAGESVAELIRDYIVIDSSPLNRRGPPGVQVAPVRWKNTRRR